MKGKGISSWTLFSWARELVSRDDITRLRFTTGQLSLPSYGYAAEVRASRRLFLIGWNLRQDRRLQEPFFFFLTRVHRQTAGSDQVHGREDNQVALDVLIDVGA